MRRERGQLGKRGTEDKSGGASGPGGGEEGLEGKGDPEEMRGKENGGSRGRGGALVTFLIAEKECLTVN